MVHNFWYIRLLVYSRHQINCHMVRVKGPKAITRYIDVLYSGNLLPLIFHMFSDIKTWKDLDINKNFGIIFKIYLHFNTLIMLDGVCVDTLRYSLKIIEI